jgi:hypothetical protein
MYCEINKWKVFNFVICYDGHGIITFYEKHNTLNAHETHTKNGIEIIATAFNLNTRRTIHIFVIYKPLAIHIENFLQLLKCIYVKAPNHCFTIFIGDLNVGMLENTSS